MIKINTKYTKSKRLYGHNRFIEETKITCNGEDAITNYNVYKIENNYSNKDAFSTGNAVVYIESRKIYGLDIEILGIVKKINGLKHDGENLYLVRNYKDLLNDDRGMAILSHSELGSGRFRESDFCWVGKLGIVTYAKIIIMEFIKSFK